MTTTLGRPHAPAMVPARTMDAPLDRAILVAETDLRRFAGTVSSGAERDECAEALAVLEEFLPHTHRNGRPQLLVEEGTITVDEATPLGSVLLVTSPDCSTSMIVRNALGALCAGNRVAVSHHRDGRRVARAVLDSLQSSLTAGRLLQFEDEPLSLPWARVSICVLTPSRVYLNDEPWNSWRFDEERGLDPERVLRFYQAHHLTRMTWERVIRP